MERRANRGKQPRRRSRNAASMQDSDAEATASSKGGSTSATPSQRSSRSSKDGVVSLEDVRDALRSTGETSWADAVASHISRNQFSVLEGIRVLGVFWPKWRLCKAFKHRPRKSVLFKWDGEYGVLLPTHFGNPENTVLIQQRGGDNINLHAARS